MAIFLLLLAVFHTPCFAHAMQMAQVEMLLTKVKIAQMVAADQTVRHEIQRCMHGGRLSHELYQYLTKTDKKNIAEFKRLLPSLNLFANLDDSRYIKNIWLLTQHADADVLLQKTILRQFNWISLRDPHVLKHCAYLHDRVCKNLNLPQRYGTQGMCRGSKHWQVFPLEDNLHVDVARKAVGLGSFQHYAQIMNELCP